MNKEFYRRLARKFPTLKTRLMQANIHEPIEDYLRKITLGALYMSVGISVFLFFIFASFNKSIIPAILAFPIIFVVMFSQFLKSPDVKIAKAEKEIDKELLFVGKFLIVEVKAGIPLHQIFKNIADNYEGTGPYFKRIIDDVEFGTNFEEAINKEMLLNPSQDFQKLLWQISNSMQTGADIAVSLGVVLEQINRKQLIEVDKYGKKLNPIAMFYLLMAVIFPSLGMVFVIVAASLLGIKLTLVVLFLIVGMLTFIQFMFYAVIKSNRPAVEI